MTEAAERTKYEAGFGVTLFVLAFVPRILVSLRLAAEPVWDGHYYDFGARRIAEGMGYSDSVAIGGSSVWHPWCHYPVGYSAFLGFFYWVFGSSPFVAHVVNAAVGALVAVLTWLVASHALSPSRAKLAGALAALHPGLVLYSALVMTEPLATLTTLIAFWIAVRDRNAIRGAILGALLLGVSALIRPTVLLLAPFLAFVAVPQSHTRATLKRLGWAAALSAVTLLPVLPWTARNCKVMDGCALVSTNAGWNLAIGAFPRATGRFETLRSSDGCREVTGQVQQDRCWFDYGVAQIKEHPLHWISLMPKKLGFTFDHESFAVEYLHEARPTWWTESRRSLGRAITSNAHRLLLCAAVFGCVGFRIRKAKAQAVLFGALVLATTLCVRDEAFWPLALLASFVPWLPIPGRPEFTNAHKLSVALLATTAFTHAIFFGEDRYHLVVTPALILLAAGALRRPNPLPDASSL